MNVAVLVNSLICISDHVGEDLIQLTEVTFNLRQFTIIDMYLGMVLGLVAENVYSTAHTLIDVDQVHFTAVFPGEGFKIRDDLLDAFKAFDGFGGKTLEVHQQILYVVPRQAFPPRLAYLFSIGVAVNQLVHGEYKRLNI